MRIPFFHYTSLDSFSNILCDGRLISRNGLVARGKKIVDISIDPTQAKREALGLTNYIPMFAGFYEKFRSYELNGYLSAEYDSSKVYNKSFYGSLNKTLQNTMGKNYERVIILLVKDELVYRYADDGKVRLFTDIAIKDETVELPVKNKEDLLAGLQSNIQDSIISAEIDLLDDGVISICCTDDIEAIIVDNDTIKKETEAMQDKHESKETEQKSEALKNALTMFTQEHKGKVTLNNMRDNKWQVVISNDLKDMFLTAFPSAIPVQAGQYASEFSISKRYTEQQQQQPSEPQQQPRPPN